MEKNKINLPSTLPVFALEDAVLLPGAIVRLETDEARAELARSLPGRHVVVALSKESGVHEMATLARVEQVDRDSGVIVTGLQRVHLSAFEEREPVPEARVDAVEVPAGEGTEVEALALEARRLSREIFALLPAVASEVVARIDGVRDPGALADLLAHYVPAKLEDKLRALETIDVKARLELVIGLLARRREVLKVAQDIAGSVQEKVSKAEREHLLRKQMEAIQAELGEGPGAEGDEDELEKKVRGLGLPEDTLALVLKELARLRKLPAASPERSVARTWLQWIADLPWSTQTPDDLEVENARRTLDADHHGLGKVKQRVLQFLAVRRLRGDLKGPILCLAGPPGVGKTSLGQSIARAMGRKFVRVSLG
ncbi:MAG TPA: LON peptidase substrate-binding domain-containing protein, partial [Myxococcales bacterium]